MSKLKVLLYSILLFVLMTAVPVMADSGWGSSYGGGGSSFGSGGASGGGAGGFNPLIYIVIGLLW